MLCALTACLAVLLDAHSALQLALSFIQEGGDVLPLQSHDTSVLKQIVDIVLVSGMF